MGYKGKGALCWLTSAAIAAGTAAMTIGGNGCCPEYVHVDLSKSPDFDKILEDANRLAASSNPEDWRTAARYYGRLGMVDEMKGCVERYADKEPDIGLIMWEVLDHVRDFYEDDR